MQQALDTVRVIGNAAVHPGTIDLRDDAGTVARLFRLTNFIVQKMITELKEIEDIYSNLPEQTERDRASRQTHEPEVLFLTTIAARGPRSRD